MSSLVSTVPGALTQLFDYVQTVVETYPNFESSQVGGYLGLPIESVENNYLMIGDDETGTLFTNYKQDWVGLPAMANRKGEQYTVPVSIRTWAGGSGELDKTTRLTEAFTLVNAFMNQIMADPNGKANGSYNLTSSGSWQVSDVSNPLTGPIGELGGWGVILRLTVEVRNVRIQG